MKGENRKIRLYGDPILRKKARPVKKIDNSIKKIIADLKVTMVTQDGLGLAANQIGELVSIFCFNPEPVNVKKDSSAPNDIEPMVVINPEIIKYEGEEEREEACLSIPNIVEVVLRAKEVVVRGLDENGKPIQIEGKGLLARVFQHEIDHLNGILFIDHLSPIRQQMLKKQLEAISQKNRQT
ncbi:MAG: peptide deformylase [candidate division WOR-3 bacterium]|nr:peptide deformylase [candidate division WOR-3 bacterium]